MSGYLGIPREKIRVVPLGINPQGFELRESKRSGPFTVGFFARIAPEKGLHVLADAYCIMRESGELPEARFGFRVSHVTQEHVVDALKILGLRRPAPVAPHDLAREAVGAEHLVAEHLRVVARLRIDVQDEAAPG